MLSAHNVPGVFSSGPSSFKGADFQTVLQQIIGITGSTVSIPRPHPWGWQPAGRILLGTSFSLAWRVFDSQYWPGTPQRRRRVFLVADFAGQSAPKILFDQEKPAWASCVGRRSGAVPSRPSSTGRCWYRLGWPVRMRAALRGHQALRLDFPPERGPARAVLGTRSAWRQP